MRKPKQRWARLTEAEQARIDDLSQEVPGDLPKLVRDPEGRLWSPVPALAAYRATHTSSVEPT